MPVPNSTPEEVKRVVNTENSDRGDGLLVTWADKQRRFYSSVTLRKFCPCANCREQRGETQHEKPLTTPAPTGRSALKVIKATGEEQTNLKSIWAVGNYAIGLEWGDRHNTGIYTFEYLGNLEGEPQ